MPFLNAKYLSHSKRPKYDCEELLERHFQAEKLIFVKNLGAHFTFKISIHQRFGAYANVEWFKARTFSSGRVTSQKSFQFCDKIVPLLSVRS